MSDPMDFELPTAFYMGDQVETAQEAAGRPLLLKASDLTTHAVCVGMTGSGKTGLGVGLLEEAALDGIPAIVIDPKGDMGNLLLTFPELHPADFKPWLSPDEADRRNMTLDAYAEKTAATWRDGLQRSRQSAERIRRLRSAADFRIYTPGSQAGLPVAVLKTLAPPADLDWERDAELVREQIESAVSALLALIGIEADPVRSREHILLTNIIQLAWAEGTALSMGDLIRAVQKPPMTQLGVFDLDSFFPAKARTELALALNTIIASPSFAAWLEGAVLDPATLLWGVDGRPQVSIFSIAHLDDRERAFFVTLLLDRLVSWMRAQPGTGGLRALVYFDEVFGFLPPYPANPPTKRPLLTLLKQARAVGLGLVLATQNPIDLDYKALSNAGVWFIGRLQTDGDKERLLDGLMGVQAGGVPLDRGRLDDTISGLPGRTFLLHNVHRAGPQLFKTRWVMSYLSGPMTREQVRTLMAPFKAGQKEASAIPATAQPAGGARFCIQCGAELIAGARFCPQCGAAVPIPVEQVRREDRPFKDELQQAAAPAPPAGQDSLSGPPVLPADMPQYYLPLPAEGSTDDAGWLYEPVVLAKAAVTMLDQRRGVDHRKDYLLALVPPEEGHAPHWETASTLDYDTDRLATGPLAEAGFAMLPQGINSSRKLAAFKKHLSDHLYVNTRLTLFHNAKLKLYSQVGEDLADFERRLREAAEDGRDAEVEKLSERFETRLDRIEDRLRREQLDLGEAEAEYAARKREEALSAAESVLRFLGSRRAGSSLSKASTKRRMTERARLEIEESKEQIEVYEKEIDDLKKEMQAEIEEIHDRWAEIAQQHDEFQVRPRRADIQIVFMAIGWRPGRR